ncbi:unnamed protein product [Calicophoron daubneyi]
MKPIRSVKPVSSSEFSGLTMNINRAALPPVPCFIPQPTALDDSKELSSFVGQEIPQSSSIKQTAELTTHTSLNPAVSTEVSAPPIHVQHGSGPSGVRPSHRPRYVLPPGLLTTSSSVSSDLPMPPVPSALSVDSGQMFAPQPSNVPEQAPIPTFLSTPINPDETPTSTTLLQSSTTASSFSAPAYQPVSAYWFYATIVNGMTVWWPFSRHDSYKIETEAFRSRMPSPVSEDLLASNPPTEVTVSVEGGRYDVLVAQRQRRSVYWDEPPTEIRRSTWFYRLPDEARVLPFSERICYLLEAQYKQTVEFGTWGQQFELPSEDRRGGSDYFIFHSPQSMVQYRAWPHSLAATEPKADLLGSLAPAYPPDIRVESSLTNAERDGRFCHLRRGLDEQLLGQVEEGEYRSVDHVFFVIHGIGTVCNLKGQDLIECVNILRRTARGIERTHFPHHKNCIEILPVTWHDALHSDATGLDDQLGQITLRSIPKLRQFINGTLMDILFYTSSKYCQVIVDRVAGEICRLRNLFLSRNPGYSGGFSIVGHSLGSVIAFDLLAHQHPHGDGSCSADSHSLTTGVGVEEVDFGDVIDDDRQADTRPEESISADKSGRSSSLGPGGELEGWSLVGYHGTPKHKGKTGSLPNLEGVARRPINPQIGDVQRNASDREKLSGNTQSETSRLANLLARVGLSEDQVNKVVKSWLIEGHNFVDKSREPRHEKPKNTSSFWSENHHATMSAGFGMPVVLYPQLGFHITALFMLGSPLSLFLTARGLGTLSSDYRLPDCSMCFNIFHPLDPVAYRLETLVDPSFQPRAVLMPHHKGRKRLHLQLKDNLARVGSDLKAKIYQSVQSTWRTLQEFAMAHRLKGPGSEKSGNSHGDEAEDESALNRVLLRLDTQPGERDDEASNVSDAEMNFNCQLNQGRRIDYVLQEAPLECFSDYLFALGSHAAYWESEDTALFLISEVYSPQYVVPLTPGQKASESVLAAPSTPVVSASTPPFVSSNAPMAAPPPTLTPPTPASSVPLDDRQLTECSLSSTSFPVSAVSNLPTTFGGDSTSSSQLSRPNVPPSACVDTISNPLLLPEPAASDSTSPPVVPKSVVTAVDIPPANVNPASWPPTLASEPLPPAAPLEPSVLHACSSHEPAAPTITSNLQARAYQHSRPHVSNAPRPLMPTANIFQPGMAASYQPIGPTMSTPSDQMGVLPQPPVFGDQHAYATSASAFDSYPPPPMTVAVPTNRDQCGVSIPRPLMGSSFGPTNVPPYFGPRAFPPAFPPVFRPPILPQMQSPVPMARPPQPDFYSYPPSSS